MHTPSQDQRGTITVTKSNQKESGRFWLRTYSDVRMSLRAWAHRARNRIIRACLEFAERIERMEAEAIAQEALSVDGPRKWLLGPPPPAPRLALQSTRSPWATGHPVDTAPDFDEAPTSVYHPIPSRDS